MEQQIFGENKSYRWFILFTNRINAWGGTHSIDTNTSAYRKFFK